MNWIKVEDKLPNRLPCRAVPVLMVNEFNVISPGVYNSNVGKFLNYEYGTLLYKITHYMEFPQPPKKDENG